ncbi:MAG TPA: VWA domain-containing protein [Pyrinomonadaceae bacterium]|nr:VWA domain-containing protein [Pyrinomonadaceae bacterium]
MTINKSLANKRSNARVRVWTVSVTIAVSVFLLVLAGASAQQDSSRQRPRRVGQPQPSPTPQTSGAPAPTQPGEEVGEGDVVRVDTQLVSVPAVVTDSAGHPLAGLRAENFRLFENGQPQVISNFATTDAPFEVALLLDTSGSTRADVQLIRRAASLFIDSLRPGDRVAIISFNVVRAERDSLATVEVNTPLTNDRARLRMALESVGASNGTPFYDALERISDDIFNEPPREEVRGRRAVVAMTDGVDSSSDAEFAEARAKLLRAGVTCYFVQVNTEDYVEERLMRDCNDFGTLRLSRTQLQRYRRIFVPRAPAGDYSSFCQMGQFERMKISRDLYNLARSEMADLARSSGGKAFEAADLRDARAAFSQVANEIGTQYSLGYYPANKARDGRFRAIRVELKGVARGAQVRAREGYYAPK